MPLAFLGHLGTLLAHIQAAVNQHSQVLLCQAAFQPLFPKPVALHGVAVAQVQDLALSFVEPHTTGPRPSIQPVQSLPTLKQINTPAQLGVICRLTEGALNPFVQIIDKDVKQNWPQHRALGNTTCDWPPTGVNSIHHHSLGLAIQPVLYLAKSTPVKATSSQFLQENAGCLPGDSIDQSPKQAEVCPPEVQGDSFADPPHHFSKYQELYHFMITLPETVSNRHMAHKSFSVREQEVQRGTFPSRLTHLRELPRKLLRHALPTHHALFARPGHRAPWELLLYRRGITAVTLVPAHAESELGPRQELPPSCSGARAWLRTHRLHLRVLRKLAYVLERLPSVMSERP
ncbi:hypothetical protein QYF61_009624 [Mycteria americana]|uniref:Uncharacterized protein n=1 Tax=Mycteria americana TaxID=33587 RepID=A0AAN7PCC0_MYCAM|nr:hypothetical protein QYF61_009624 [Mycteria americana]